MNVADLINRIVCILYVAWGIIDVKIYYEIEQGFGRVTVATLFDLSSLYWNTS
jgi:hypothetical protein